MEKLSSRGKKKIAKMGGLRFEISFEIRVQDFSLYTNEKLSRPESSRANLQPVTRGKNSLEKKKRKKKKCDNS